MTSKLLRTFIDTFLDTKCTVCKSHDIAYPSGICTLCKKYLFSSCTPPVTATEHVKEIFSCLYYKNIVKRYICNFKYYRDHHAINISKDIIQRKIRHEFPKNIAPDLIIPIPLHRTKYIIRGFNQSVIIAKILSDIICVPVSSDNLIKVKNTPAQTSLTRKQRLKNLNNSFSVLRPSMLSGRSILIVDDIMTTGTTLDICASELIKHEVKDIYGFTLARTH